MIEGQPEYAELYLDPGPLQGSGWFPCYPDDEFIRQPEDLPSIWFDGKLILGCYQARKVFTAPMTVDAINEALLTMNYQTDCRYVIPKQKPDPKPQDGAATHSFDVVFDEHGLDRTIAVRADKYIIDNGMLHFYLGRANAATFAHGCWKRVIGV